MTDSPRVFDKSPQSDRFAALRDDHSQSGSNASLGRPSNDSDMITTPGGTRRKRTHKWGPLRPAIRVASALNFMMNSEPQVVGSSANLFSRVETDSDASRSINDIVSPANDRSTPRSPLVPRPPPGAPPLDQAARVRVRHKAAVLTRELSTLGRENSKLMKSETSHVDITNLDALLLLRTASTDALVTDDRLKEKVRTLVGKRGVVTEYEEGEDQGATPYHLQGDADMYTRDKLEQRLRLKTHPRVVEAIDNWWKHLDVRSDQLLRKSTYLAHYKRVYKALMTDFSREESSENALKEWKAETRGALQMMKDDFHSSMFELADLWSNGLDVQQYVSFLNGLFHHIHKHGTWLPVSEIDLFMSDDAVADPENRQEVGEQVYPDLSGDMHDIWTIFKYLPGLGWDAAFTEIGLRSIGTVARADISRFRGFSKHNGVQLIRAAFKKYEKMKKLKEIEPVYPHLAVCDDSVTKLAPYLGDKNAVTWLADFEKHGLKRVESLSIMDVTDFENLGFPGDNPLAILRTALRNYDVARKTRKSFRSSMQQRVHNEPVHQAGVLCSELTTNREDLSVLLPHLSDDGWFKQVKLRGVHTVGQFASLTDADILSLSTASGVARQSDFGSVVREALAAYRLDTLTNFATTPAPPPKSTKKKKTPKAGFLAVTGVQMMYPTLAKHTKPVRELEPYFQNKKIGPVMTRELTAADLTTIAQVAATPRPKLPDFASEHFGFLKSAMAEYAEKKAGDCIVYPPLVADDSTVDTLIDYIALTSRPENQRLTTDQICQRWRKAFTRANFSTIADVAGCTVRQALLFPKPHSLATIQRAMQAYEKGSTFDAEIRESPVLRRRGIFPDLADSREPVQALLPRLPEGNWMTAFYAAGIAQVGQLAAFTPDAIDSWGLPDASARIARALKLMHDGVQVYISDDEGEWDSGDELTGGSEFIARGQQVGFAETTQIVEHDAYPRRPQTHHGSRSSYSHELSHSHEDSADLGQTHPSSYHREPRRRPQTQAGHRRPQFATSAARSSRGQSSTGGRGKGKRTKTAPAQGRKGVAGSWREILHPPLINSKLSISKLMAHLPAQAWDMLSTRSYRTVGDISKAEVVTIPSVLGRDTIHLLRVALSRLENNAFSGNEWNSARPKTVHSTRPDAADLRLSTVSMNTGKREQVVHSFQFRPTRQAIRVAGFQRNDAPRQSAPAQQTQRRLPKPRDGPALVDHEPAARPRTRVSQVANPGARGTRSSRAALSSLPTLRDLYSDQVTSKARAAMDTAEYRRVHHAAPKYSTPTDARLRSSKAVMTSPKSPRQTQIEVPFHMRQTYHR